MKKLFENWNKYKNETEELEEGIEQIADQMTPENFGYALQALQKVAANFAPAVVGTLLFAALTKYREDKSEKEATTDLNESIGVDTEELLRLQSIPRPLLNIFLQGQSLGKRLF